MIVLKHYSKIKKRQKQMGPEISVTENAAAFAFLGSSCAAVSDRVLSTKLQI